MVFLLWNAWVKAISEQIGFCWNWPEIDRGLKLYGKLGQIGQFFLSKIDADDNVKGEWCSFCEHKNDDSEDSREVYRSTFAKLNKVWNYKCKYRIILLCKDVIANNRIWDFRIWFANFDSENSLELQLFCINIY